MRQTQTDIFDRICVIQRKVCICEPRVIQISGWLLLKLCKRVSEIFVLIYLFLFWKIHLCFLIFTWLSFWVCVCVCVGVRPTTKRRNAVGKVIFQRELHHPSSTSKSVSGCWRALHVKRVPQSLLWLRHSFEWRPLSQCQLGLRMIEIEKKKNGCVIERNELMRPLQLLIFAWS